MFFKANRDRSTNERTCDYHHVPDQCGPTVEQIAEANRIRVSDTVDMFKVWCDEHNKNKLPLPNTDEEATEWMLRNDVLPDEDEPPAAPSSQSTPRKGGSSRNSVSAEPSFIMSPFTY